MNDYIVNRKIKITSITHDPTHPKIAEYIRQNVSEFKDSSSIYEFFRTSTPFLYGIKMFNSFENLHVNLSIDEDSLTSSDVIPLHVHLFLKKKKSYTGLIKQQISTDGKVTLNVALKASNIAGSLGDLQIDACRGYSDRSADQISFTHPVSSNPFHRIAGSIFRRKRHFSSKDFLETSFGTNLSYIIANSWCIHSFTLENAFRFNSLLSDSVRVPFYKRLQAGPGLVTSFLHTWTTDNRDCTIFPTTGPLLRFEQRLNAIDKTKVYYQPSLSAQYNLPLGQSNDNKNSSALTFSFKAGTTIPLISETSGNVSSCFNDRFYLGGPSNVRGTEWESLGPSVKGNVSGADSFIQAALHLQTPLPLSTQLPSFFQSIRTHSFVEGYKMDEFDSKNSIGSNLKSFVTSPFLFNLGFGLAFNFKNALRIEINGSLPLSEIIGATSLPKPKFGFGLMTEFF